MRLTPRELGRREGAQAERERIARWLDERADGLRVPVDQVNGVAREAVMLAAACRMLAVYIRSGDHARMTSVSGRLVDF